MSLIILLCSIALLAWSILLLSWGDFWRADCRLSALSSAATSTYPRVRAIVPARNEAEAIAESLTSLLQQDYPGEFSITLVDDNSSDRTSEIARNTAEELGRSNRLNVLAGQPLAEGWKGKLWAMHQGIEASSDSAIDYFWFTDADIKHESYNLTRLVTKAETEDLDLVSLMVLLRCQNFWEKLLIPAFVFFFQLLYPFPWVNDPQRSTAAAAGGCSLIRAEALDNIGGLSSIKQALIDDCTLAKAVKFQGKIWLGLSETTLSLRGYDRLSVIWDTIARTAYTQLSYDPVLLFGTVCAMSVVYLSAPFSLVWGLVTSNWILAAIAVTTWILMTIAFLPTLKLYKLPSFWAFALPAIAFLYTLMTIDSARKYYQGVGGAWKGRTYQ